MERPDWYAGRGSEYEISVGHFQRASQVTTSVEQPPNPTDQE